MAWVKRDIATTGLPVIAVDGSAVVIAHRDNDGGRGLYFDSPEGHNLEIITRPYGSGG